MLDGTNNQVDESQLQTEIESSVLETSIANTPGEIYNKQLRIVLPANMEMGELLTELENLFARCKNQYWRCVYTIDLSRLGNFSQMKYMRRVVGIIQKYFVGPENNHLFLINSNSAWQGLIQVPLQLASLAGEVNIRFVVGEGEELESKLAERIKQLCDPQPKES